MKKLLGILVMVSWCNTVYSENFICLRGSFGDGAKDVVNNIYQNSMGSFYIKHNDHTCSPKNGLKISEIKLPKVYNFLKNVKISDLSSGYVYKFRIKEFFAKIPRSKLLEVQGSKLTSNKTKTETTTSATLTKKKVEQPKSEEKNVSPEVSQKIKQIEELYESGALTKEEYEEAKKRALN